MPGLAGHIMDKVNKFQGIIWAVVLISLWSANLAYWIQVDFSWSDPFVYLSILIQTHLYTGLFITSHDAIHGGVYAENPRLNQIWGVDVALNFQEDVERPGVIRRQERHERYVKHVSKGEAKEAKERFV